MGNYVSIIHKGLLKLILLTAIALSMGTALYGCAGDNAKESTGELIDDSVITAKVKTAIADELGVRSTTDISVETFKGVVQISGFVASEDERLLAEQAAKNVAGIVELQNRIAVK